MASLRPWYHVIAASECSALIFPYRWSRSRSAREVMFTTYAMPGFELGEKLPHGPSLSFFRLVQALADAFLRISVGGNVEQALIGFGVLHDGRRLPLHRKHHGPV